MSYCKYCGELIDWIQPRRRKVGDSGILDKHFGGLTYALLSHLPLLRGAP